MRGQSTRDTHGTAGMILLSCAGNNANTIHYIESLGGVEAWDLLPMDLWTEFHEYSKTAGMILLLCVGNNTNPIHYIETVCGVEAGDLLLIYAGTEYH
jgi:Xaa-Pro aminopeptidase